ncbi:hypothetical protein KIM372_09370 [Bombiscardovia nodaiensis]|uniref:Major facilitator superfamily (MFS) profile domain-containing protein n=1 Tax=Bombiscardovia nodaiensis TaxID=2932181 RepID=A0ABN6SDX8_9BIFI|nr:hypothetical protein KIM372_09370 [Bombiscardovia nodaiensis]
MLCIPERETRAEQRPITVGKPAFSHYWQDLRDGLRFVLRQPLLRSIVVIVLILNALDAARFSVLLPLYSLEFLGGSAAAGLITGALATGALAGSFIFSAWGHRLPRRALFVICFALTGGPLSLGFYCQAPEWALVALSAATGIFTGMLNPLIGTLRLEQTEPDMLARVQSFMIAISWAGIPIGSLLSGFAAERLSLPLLYGIIGVIYVLTACLPIVDTAWNEPELRTYKTSTPTT